MNVAKAVLVLGWWRLVYSSRSDDSVMVCVCYPGSSGGVVVYGNSSSGFGVVRVCMW